MVLHFVVACGRRKRQDPAPARDLYTGAHFRFVLATAEAEAAATTRDLGAPTQVWVLSARYGLVSPEQVLAPYEQTIRTPGAVPMTALATQAHLHGFTSADEVFTFLPHAYRDRLAAALGILDIAVTDLYEAAPGIGYQRRVCAVLRRPLLTAGTPPPAG